jgi:dihydrofolate reductase
MLPIMSEKLCISLLVAAADNDVIGRDNALPWRLPDDLKRFKALTMGKPMLMGRKTFESIGKALPGRTSIVLTRSKSWGRNAMNALLSSGGGVIVVNSLDEALKRVGDASELAVIGGAEIYKLALPKANRIYLTRVHTNAEGDVKLPPITMSEWREVERIEHPADEKHEFAMTFLTLDRVAA